MEVLGVQYEGIFLTIEEIQIKIDLYVFICIIVKIRYIKLKDVFINFLVNFS